MGLNRDKTIKIAPMYSKIKLIKIRIIAWRTAVMGKDFCNLYTVINVSSDLFLFICCNENKDMNYWVMGKFIGVGLTVSAKNEQNDDYLRIKFICFFLYNISILI